jgi:hypothetical protein
MSIVVTYVAYLLISASLTALAGRVLSRSGRLFLVDAVGGSDSAARGISNLIVVSFYLISLGFVALTMQTSSDHVSARQAIQLLATKLGAVLLVLGALYLLGILTLTRLRRRLKAQAQPSAEQTARAGLATPASAPAGQASAPAGPLSPRALWPPTTGRRAH